MEFGFRIYSPKAYYTPHNIGGGSQPQLDVTYMINSQSYLIGVFSEAIVYIFSTRDHLESLMKIEHSADSYQRDCN